MNAEYYRFRLGNYESVSLYDGFSDYTLEGFFTNVPRSEVEAALQAHGFSSEAVTTPYTFLYVNTGKHRILVDIGVGSLLPTAGKLLHSMSKAGITAESIDAIFITHTHLDHIGGALNEKGEPTFINATYYICKEEWDFRFPTQPTSQPEDRWDELARERLKPLKSKTVLLEREGEILPSVSVLFAPGHTPGHMVISFASHGEQLLYVGDTVLHPLHLEHPDWLSGIDSLPELAANSKQRIFDLAASTQCWVMGQQFPPFPSLGHVIKKEVGWEWRPIKNDNQT